VALAPYFCLWSTIKPQFLHKNHMLGSLDFTRSEHWTPLNFSCALCHYSGTSPLGHLYLRDTSIQGTQNLVLEKCSHNLCPVSVSSIEGTPLDRGN